MDSDSELQICEQPETSDLVDNRYSSDNLQKDYEEQTENSCDNIQTDINKGDEIPKVCPSFSKVNKTEDQPDCNNDLIAKSNVTSKFQNDNINITKKKPQGTNRKFLTPLMKNALKQSRQEVSLLDHTKKTDKKDQNITIAKNIDVVEKVQTKPNRVRSAICIDASDAPPMKMAKKPKPSNSLLNKITNIKQNSSSKSLLKTPVPATSGSSVESTKLNRLPSNLVISNLKKQYNCSKEEAVRKFVEKCRENNSKVDNASNAEENKLRVQADEMPWIPNFIFPDRNQFTSLSDADHKRYVAIIMNLINQNPEFRFVHNVTELKDFDNRLLSERKLFHKISFEAIDSKKKSCYRFKLPSWNKMIYSFTEARSKDLKKFSKDEYEVIDNYEFNSNIEALSLSTLRIHEESQGDGAVVNIPDLRKKCIFNSKTIHEKKKFYSVNSINADKNAEVISSTHDARILMDATTFSRLLIGKWGCDNLEYSFPINVAQEFVDGGLENIVTISKPIPSSPPSTRTLAYRFMKYVVKGAVDKNYFDIPKEAVNDTQNESEIDDFAPSSPFFPTSPTRANDDSTPNIIEHTNENKANDDNSYHRGKIYHILNLNTGTSDPNFNILVRSNCAEKDCFGKKLSVSHHVEYFPEIGAENLFPEEIVRNYIKCFFKDANHAVIFRVHSSSYNVLQKEFIDLHTLQNRVYNECLNIWKNGLQKVRNLLMKLMTVSGGEYLLEEDDNNFKLYSKTIPIEDDTENVQTELRKALQGSNQEDDMIRNGALNSSGIFNGVSYHVPLMWNFVLSRIPGSLPKRKKNVNQDTFHNNKGKHKKKFINN
uniref:NARG2_C domain-containing protein n=1 Tax=Strongyloides papillosus TaxID=174720 RepID=A0A0N5B625_STREA